MLVGVCLVVLFVGIVGEFINIGFFVEDFIFIFFWYIVVIVMESKLILVWYSGLEIN